MQHDIADTTSLRLTLCTTTSHVFITCHANQSLFTCLRFFPPGFSMKGLMRTDSTQHLTTVNIWQQTLNMWQHTASNGKQHLISHSIWQHTASESRESLHAKRLHHKDQEDQTTTAVSDRWGQIRKPMSFKCNRATRYKQKTKLQSPSHSQVPKQSSAAQHQTTKK